MKKLFIILLGVLLTFFMFAFYASTIHNQYFSNVAGIDRNVEVGDKCSDVYTLLSNYKNTLPSEVFMSKSDIRSDSVWSHIEGIVSAITLNDDSTPFDIISYYVFCGEDGRVISTYLVGD